MFLVLLLPGDTLQSATKKKAGRRVPRRHRAAAPQPVATATGATLEARLQSLLDSPVAAGSIASVQIAEVESGHVVGQRNPDLLVAPASNMKLFTTAAALDLLKPTFELTTSVYIRGAVDKTGTLNGDVKFVGGGDPTIGSRFHDGKATAVIETWVRELKKQGINAVAGNLVFEYGYMDTEYIHPTWPVDQLVNWYEAPISAFTMQEGCVMVRILPSRPGQKAIIQLEPPNTHVTVENSCLTGARRGIFVTRMLGTNNIIVRGGVPVRSGNSDIYVTIMNPIDYFANVTAGVFQTNGIRVGGQIQLVPKDPREDWRLVAQHKTPLPIINLVINKKSQNHYAEELIKIIGAETKKNGSWKGGSAAIAEWLQTKVGVPPEQIQQIDGSGMSRFNRVTAHAFIDLLRYMWKSPYRGEFLSSMPYSGEPDSRLKHRLNQPPYARQVYAKTGYIVGVIGLSGYVHAQSGKVYAFSFLFNKYHSGVWGVYRLQEEMLKEIIKGG
ncbi:MAG TPA: D-alanyl-D-alanine carboxypeptidase/D-alanyl-D-alanine-endopeptidase [Thermoanaerobaculia bacterium]|nr:D-alanyl-D-alanine carboxypeptidase/D-alanyl-D-alanine-endopeptidase [Thermoanaerobaculia bacterium]